MLEIINYFRIRYMGEKAQGLVEYALLLAFIVVVGAAVAGSDSIQSHVSNIFTNVKNIVNNADK
ncbi:Flp family type IVb pilin [Selenomonas ruminantium]|uniref:Pilus assembly protein Flp/PilA n=1 Tax=Selenomonas ruminantium TaxID=971 RepID=A0A1H3YUQ0_SELRU|nr:hypothetical protein [Selenomonas ruminantium]SEA14772.1 pilus assembly protein Flp/PilA [Selenomonas ruminantium]